jgi:hypothetical protein
MVAEMSTTIERTQPISVTLSAEQQAVMQVLSNGSYNMVAPLIGSIQQQCMRHAVPERPTEASVRNGTPAPFNRAAWAGAESEE